MNSDVTNPDNLNDHPTQAGINSFHDFKMLLTNARSLSPKINSLHTFFREHKLDFSLITESWLKDSALLDRDIIDLEWGTNLKIIYKNRPRTRAGLRKVGGGVSIIYDKSKCSLRERKIEGNKYELVLAVGKVGNIARQVAIFCVYLEPRMKAGEVKVGDEFPEAPTRQPLTPGEVAKRLKDAKKPNSQVRGDLLPRVMKKHHQLLVTPVTMIFNAVFKEGKWPDAWKEETTVVIPKVANPETLADCRNISCTPFLSKVLEGVLLDDLRGVIAPDPVQYGGIKGCSVDHLLVDLFDAVLEPMEAGASSVVLGIDYEKAFNCLDHRECLVQLQRLGASQMMINLTRFFLTNRLMRVMVGKLLSSPYILKGRSPQGSILGCFLYCITMQQLNLELVNGDAQRLHQQAPVPPEADGNTRGTASDGEPGGFGLMPGDAEVTLNSSADSFRTAESAPDLDLEPGWDLDGEALIALFKYVDDTTFGRDRPCWTVHQAHLQCQTDRADPCPDHKPSHRGDPAPCQ